MSINSKIRNVCNVLEGMANELTEQQQATLRMAQGELADAADWVEGLEHKPLCDVVAGGDNKEERL
jgi:hypothetical protein